MKVGDLVKYENCTCGDGGVTDGNIYEVVAIMPPMFVFYDDNGDIRIRNLNNGCFKLLKGGDIDE